MDVKNGVSRGELMFHLGLIWMYLAFGYMIMLGAGTGRWFTVLLLCVSIAASLVYMGKHWLQRQDGTVEPN